MNREKKPKELWSMNGKKMNFVAVDVETANSDPGSICQVGVAVVESAEITGVWTQLVDPRDFFDPANVAIHGIGANMVEGCPVFEDIHGRMLDFMKGIVVSHTLFDLHSISRAFESCGKRLNYGHWLDSAKIARRAWPERYARRGYGLAEVAGNLGISFRHHDAGEDAKAAAEIVLRACADTGLDIEKWLGRVKLPIRKKSRAKFRGAGRKARRAGRRKL